MAGPGLSLWGTGAGRDQPGGGVVQTDRPGLADSRLSPSQSCRGAGHSPGRKLPAANKTDRGHKQTLLKDLSPLYVPSVHPLGQAQGL